MGSQPPEAGLKAGDRHYKAFVGPIEKYDLMGAMQFNLLTTIGLRQDHTLLDVGCGSLRAGKLFVPYLLPDHYFGIEPEQWLIEEGIQHELGRDCLQLKRPRFDHNAGFQLSVFGQQFDYIIAHSIFSHAPRAQIRACLAEAAKVMKPTSIFVATYLAGEEDYDGETSIYPERVTYSRNSMTALTREANLRSCHLVNRSTPGIWSPLKNGTMQPGRSFLATLVLLLAALPAPAQITTITSTSTARAPALGC